MDQFGLRIPQNKIFYFSVLIFFLILTFRTNFLSKQPETSRKSQLLTDSRIVESWQAVVFAEFTTVWSLERLQYALERVLTSCDPPNTSKRKQQKQIWKQPKLCDWNENQSRIWKQPELLPSGTSPNHQNTKKKKDRIHVYDEITHADDRSFESLSRVRICHCLESEIYSYEVLERERSIERESWYGP